MVIDECKVVVIVKCGRRKRKLLVLDALLIFFFKGSFMNKIILFSNNLISIQAMAALNEFAFAEQDLSNSIRSRPAYLMGVLRKYRSGSIGLNFMAGHECLFNLHLWLQWCHLGERSRSKPGKPHVGGGGGGSDSYRYACALGDSRHLIVERVVIAVVQLAL